MVQRLPWPPSLSLEDIVRSCFCHPVRVPRLTGGSCSLQVRRPVALAAHQCASGPWAACSYCCCPPPSLQPLAAHLEALLLHHQQRFPPALNHHSIASPHRHNLHQWTPGQAKRSWFCTSQSLNLWSSSGDWPSHNMTSSSRSCPFFRLLHPPHETTLQLWIRHLWILSAVSGSVNEEESRNIRGLSRSGALSGPIR